VACTDKKVRKDLDKLNQKTKLEKFNLEKNLIKKRIEHIHIIRFKCPLRVFVIAL